MTLLERAKALATQIEECIKNEEEVSFDAQEEFENITEELLKPNFPTSEAIEVMKVLSEIQDPEDDTEKLWTYSNNFPLCIQNIATPINIGFYLLDNGKDESEKIVFNGSEITIKQMIDFFDIIEMKKTAIGHSFFTEGKINDTNESLNLNLFKKI